MEGRTSEIYAGIAGGKVEKKMKKFFCDEDILSRRHFADLAEYGEFRGECIEFDPDTPHLITAHGTLILAPRHLDGETAELQGQLDIELDPSSFDEGEDIEALTAGEIFCLPWRNWTSEDIPEDWEF